MRKSNRLEVVAGDPRFSAGGDDVVSGLRTWSLLPFLFLVTITLVIGLQGAESGSSKVSSSAAGAVQPPSSVEAPLKTDADARAPEENGGAVVDSTNRMEALDQTHRLAPGDRLSFRILEDEDDPRQVMVADSGDLELPYIGRYPATGKTCRDLAFSLSKEFEKEYFYHATVILAVDVLARSRGKVYLVGRIRAPGPQDIPSDEVFTLSKAVLRAGGFSDYADQRNVRVTRKGKGLGTSEQTFIVNLEDVIEKGKTESDLVLQVGDLVFIPEKSVRF
jgi:protein involved in polysaccharide export with SLBB domain